jgi:protein-tyrosine kinase
MSRIYDALENARMETVPPRETETFPSITLPDHSKAGRPDADMEQEMMSLYQTITTSLPDIESRSVLLMGSRSNEGTSTIARQLAKAVTLRMEKKVLLIDLDRSRPDLHVYGSIGAERGAKDDSGDHDMYRVEESSLHVMPLFQRTMVTPRTIDSVKTPDFWAPLKSQFDLIIVDCPPGTTFPEGPSIASQVDGIILVVEAERTRWQVALKMKETILKSGGNILGIVFNRQRHYIPGFIYRWL